MSTEIRYNLLRMLSNDAIAFKTANSFVSDDAVKFEAFKDCYGELAHNPNVQNRAKEAIDLAQDRWDVIS